MGEGKRGIYKYEPLWDDWHIDELIGKGSYGEVYTIYKEKKGKKEYAAAKYISIPKDEDRKNYRKFTHNELTTILADRMDKFSVEISSMLKLKNSKNVVHYEDHIIQEKDGEPGWDIIIRMELLTTLEDYLDDHDFTKNDVVKLGIDICSAISSCQEHDIVHRDIKIENMFMDTSSNYKLGDFGVSKEGKGTATGTVTGTEDYMAPEITQEHKYNNTVDLYSLGIAMYQLLNNRRNPFIDADKIPTSDDESNAQLRRMNGEAFPNPKYDDGELARIVLKACAFDKNDRYGTPDEMARDLKKLLGVYKEVVLVSKGKRNKLINDDPTVYDADEKKEKKKTVSEFDNVKKIKKGKKGFIFGAIAATIAILAIIILATSNNKEEAVTYKILKVPTETVQMLIGDTYKIDAEKSPINAEGYLYYESSNNNIASVDESGTVTAISKGDATITICFEDVKKEVSVHIEEKRIPVTGIQGNIKESLELVEGENTQLICSVEPGNATDQEIKYLCSDDAIATIGPDGVITAVKAGKVIITAEAADGISKSMELTVKARPTEKKVQTKTTSGSGYYYGGSSGGSGGYTQSAETKQTQTQSVQQPQPQPQPQSQPQQATTEAPPDIEFYEK